MLHVAASIITCPHRFRQKNITRSKEEAIEILRGYQAEINGSPEKFAELAKVHSDCSSAKSGGDLGPFGRVRLPLLPCTSVLH